MRNGQWHAHGGFVLSGLWVVASCVRRGFTRGSQSRFHGNEEGQQNQNNAQQTAHASGTKYGMNAIKSTTPSNGSRGYSGRTAQALGRITRVGNGKLAWKTLMKQPSSN